MATTLLTQLVAIECAQCGVAYGISAKYERCRQDDHRTFYCPNGHTQYFPGKSDAEKERERAERLAQQLERKDREIANLDEDVRSARASLAATKGQLTKTKKRAANGVCPCCNRSFANVQRHVKGQHPEFVEASK